MSAQTAFDITPLTWVKGEIDLELALARQYLEQFFNKPEDTTQLKFCHDHLHQVNGAVRMVGLEGLARFVAELENLVSALEKGEVALQPSTHDLSRRAIGAASHYLDGLMNGEANVPLRLFPIYRELSQARGSMAAAESDLFFPDLRVSYPGAKDRPPLSRAELETLAKVGRARFQRGLLMWLRNPNDPNSLQEMLKAVSAIAQASTPPAQQPFWWVAAGFLDGLVHHGFPIGPHVKQACGKIEQEMRRLGEGDQSTAEKVMRDLLYQVALSKPVTDRVRAIQQAYDLRRQLPGAAEEGPSEAEAEKLKAALDEMREHVTAAKEAWVKVSTGGLDAVSTVLERAVKLRESAARLKHQALEKLINVIGGAANELRANPARLSEAFTMEMATGFLLVEHAIENFTKLPGEFAHQVEALTARLRSAALGKWDEAALPEVPQLDAISRQAQEQELLAQVGHEIQANLKQIEQVLDGFFRDPAKRSELPALEPLLKQIAGMLIMLTLDKAGQLLGECEKLIAKFADSEYSPAQQETELLADSVSSLGFYIEALQHDQADKYTMLDPVLRRFGIAPAEKPAAVEEAPRVAAPVFEALAPTAAPEIVPAPVPEQPVPAPIPEAVPATAEAVIDKPSDPEIAEVFLEESQEVLVQIGENLRTCQQDPANRDALTAIRRSFHTLKGSGRMVGLTNLGEVAWAIEQVMNKWLESQNAATPDLLEMVARARRHFEDWIGDLKRGGQVRVRADELLDLTERLGARPAPIRQAAAAKVEAPAAPMAPPVVSAAPVVEAAPAEPEAVVIGTITIEPALFEIFSTEAGQHLATLEAEFNAVREHPEEPVRREFMRAAHTLAGTARLAGLTFIAELSYALEQWLDALMEAPQTLKADELGVMEKAISLLHRMLEQVTVRRFPVQADLDASAATVHLLQGLLKAKAETPAGALPVIEVVEMPVEAEPQKPAEAPAPEMPAVKPPGERRVIRDDIDPQLLAIFTEEAQELVPLIGGELRAWRAAPEDPEAPQALKRTLHTLKGSARMAGAMRLGELTHKMESQVEAYAAEGGVAPSVFDDLDAQFDRLQGSLEAFQAGFEAEAEVEAEPVIPSVALPAPPQPVTPLAPTAAPSPEIAELAAAQPMLRVRADLLDRLVNEAGEVSIARSRIETEMHSIKQSLLDLTESLTRLRNQLREVEIQAESQMQSRMTQIQDHKQEFDPLEFDRFTSFQEITRMMAESVNDVSTIQQTLLKNLDETEAALVQQARMSRELQQELMRVRAVPFGSYGERLYRVVRQAARDMGKKANLDIRGSEVEIDRSVLDRINSPLEHMLRNSLAHGLETPQERIRAGKPETGQIVITVRQEGNEVVIALSDDGAGLNLERIRQKALEKGLLDPGQTVSDTQAMQFIFSQGFSTASEVTQVSGRGVGMDVVRNEINALGGRVEIASKQDQGTTFTLYLPLTLAVAQVVLVQAAGRTYAVPSAMVESVQEVKPADLAAYYQSREVQALGNVYPFHYLPQMLGDNEAEPEPKRYNTVLLLRKGPQRVAVHVDELSGNREVVVKNVGPQLAKVPGVEGATVLGDGNVGLIINPVQLLPREQLFRGHTKPEPAPAPAVAQKPVTPIVMVVDDSLTVRKITSRVLSREGFQVITAKDGVDALEQLQETIPDVMLVDIEMPRMDGFDLTKNVRANPRTANVPIIMITSRTAEKHRSYAKELGVNIYLGKPYQEDDLLRHITSLIRH